MSWSASLVGLEESEALRFAREAGRVCRIVHYAASDADDTAGSPRVVRATERKGTLELIICEFRTDASQG